MSTPRSPLIYFKIGTLPFWAMHATALIGVIATGWSWSGAALAIGMYFAGMFFVTGGYHRYFAHRTYKTSRWFQFVLALGASATAQKGVLWWAANHRHHHRHSDTPEDIHSPVQSGFWWSHLGWIIVRDYDATRWDNIKDFARFPELRWLNRFHLVPSIALALAMFFFGSGWHSLLWGYFVPVTVLWHGTFTINSLSHVFGRRRYPTSDDSRNNWLLALITMGEGWHNNHHHYMNSANQGFRWYEVDMTFYVLRGLQACRLIHDVRRAPQHIVENRRRTPKKRIGVAPLAGDIRRAA